MGKMSVEQVSNRHGWKKGADVRNLSCENAELRYATPWIHSGWSDSPYNGRPRLARSLSSAKSFSSSRLFSDQPQNRTY